MDNKTSWHPDAVDIFNAILFKDRCSDEYIEEKSKKLARKLKVLEEHYSEDDAIDTLIQFTRDMMMDGFNNGFWGAINYFIDHNIFPGQFDGWNVSIDKAPTKEEFFKFAYFESLFAEIFDECKKRSLKTEENLRFWLEQFLTGHIENMPWFKPDGRQWYMDCLNAFIEDCKRCYYHKGIADSFSMFEETDGDIEKLNACFGTDERHFVQNVNTDSLPGRIMSRQ